mgnify:CR=1 FL=1
MSCECHDHCTIESRGRDSVTNPAWRRALWIALVLNLAMFVVELAAGLQADSVSLLADAVDFFGDAANYGLSLAVLAMALHWRTPARAVVAVLCLVMTMVQLRRIRCKLRYVMWPMLTWLQLPTLVSRRKRWLARLLP